MAAVTATLSRYSEEVITRVTHPETGLPKTKNWLPTIKEVADACYAAAEADIENEIWLKRAKEQLEERERIDRGERPTMEQLKAKYGPNWGLNPDPDRTAKPDKPAPSWNEIVDQYQSSPGRLASLLKRDE